MDGRINGRMDVLYDPWVKCMACLVARLQDKLVAMIRHTDVSSHEAARQTSGDDYTQTHVESQGCKTDHWQ